MSDEDPIKRRAEEIRAERASAATNQATHDAEVRTERVRVVRSFLDALTERTPHAIQCSELDARPHGAVAWFTFMKDGRAWTQNMFEFGIDRVDGEPQSRAFSYYLEPTSAAFSIPNPETGVARALKASSESAVQSYAIAIAIEMMARIVASGGVFGSPAEIDEALAAQERSAERRARQQKKERSRKFWSGCGVAVLWLFGVMIAIGLLGNIVRACSSG